MPAICFLLGSLLEVLVHLKLPLIRLNLFHVFCHSCVTCLQFLLCPGLSCMICLQFALVRLQPLHVLDNSCVLLLHLLFRLFLCFLVLFQLRLVLAKFFHILKKLLVLCFRLFPCALLCFLCPLQLLFVPFHLLLVSFHICMLLLHFHLGLLFSFQQFLQSTMMSMEVIFFIEHCLVETLHLLLGLLLLVFVLLKPLRVRLQGFCIFHGFSMLFLSNLTQALLFLFLSSYTLVVSTDPLNILHHCSVFDFGLLSC
mmetsp:Transcript_29762/g.53983  ORF Transcript_29762/g.53983 Transcript_29762/m.53983 type:complete len:255 (+) Transcript_29762:2305-3069(+)